MEQGWQWRGVESNTRWLIRRLLTMGSMQSLITTPASNRWRDFKNHIKYKLKCSLRQYSCNTGHAVTTLHIYKRAHLVRHCISCSLFVGAPRSGTSQVAGHSSECEIQATSQWVIVLAVVSSFAAQPPPQCGLEIIFLHAVSTAAICTANSRKMN